MSVKENKIDIMLKAQIEYTEKLWKEKDKLQQRIDKAIKWIKEDYDGGYFECGENDIKELLEILGDKENE